MLEVEWEAAQGLMEEIQPRRELCRGCREREARHKDQYLGPVCRPCFIYLCCWEAQGKIERKVC